MRSVLCFALLASASASTTPYVQFIDGFITGIDPTVGGKIAPCINDNNGAFIDIQQGLQLVETGIQSRNLSALYAGILDFQAALASVQQAAAACGEAQFAADIGTLLAALASNPFLVLAELLPYFGTVSSDLTNAVSLFNSGNYSGSGYNVGQVFAILLAHDTARVSIASAFERAAKKLGGMKKVGAGQSSYVQFLNGVLTAVEPAVAGNISACIPASDSGASDIDMAIILLQQAVNTKSIALLLEAAQDAKQGLSILRLASAACGEQQAAADFAKIINDLETDPLGVAARLFPYTPEIFEDVSNGIADWRAGQWNQAGQDFGGVLAMVLNVA